MLIDKAVDFPIMQKGGLELVRWTAWWCSVTS